MHSAVLSAGGRCPPVCFSESPLLLSEAVPRLVQFVVSTSFDAKYTSGVAPSGSLWTAIRNLSIDLWPDLRIGIEEGALRGAGGGPTEAPPPPPPPPPPRPAALAPRPSPHKMLTAGDVESALEAMAPARRPRQPPPPLYFSVCAL